MIYQPLCQSFSLWLCRDSIYLLNVFWGKLMLSLYICAKLFADIVCHTNYRYISKYICISMLLLPIVYSRNAWRCSQSMFSTAGVCWKNSHLIVNKERKHIPNLLIDSHWCHFSQCGGNTVYPVRPNSGWHKYNTAGHTEVHTLWSFYCLQRDKAQRGQPRWQSSPDVIYLCMCSVWLCFWYTFVSHVDFTKHSFMSQSHCLL